MIAEELWNQYRNENGIEKTETPVAWCYKRDNPDALLDLTRQGFEVVSCQIVI